MPSFQKIAWQLLDPPEDNVRASKPLGPLEELAESIKKHGILQPLIVVPENGRYRVRVGDRRYYAAHMAGVFEIPCMVYDPGELSDVAAMIDENVCREDVTAAEIGWAILALREKTGMDWEAIARRLRRSLDWIGERVNIVEADAAVAHANAAGQISFSVAKEIAKCQDGEFRPYLLDVAIRCGSTAVNIREMVRNHRRENEPAPPPPNAGGVTLAAQGITAPDYGCAFCSGTHDVGNMKQLYVHWYELPTLKKILQDAGLEAKWL